MKPKRKRINACSVCSSEDYRASKHAHLNYLREVHDSLVSGKLDFSEENYAPRYKYITVWGKRIKLTLEEYARYTAYQ